MIGPEVVIERVIDISGVTQREFSSRNCSGARRRQRARGSRSPCRPGLLFRAGGIGRPRGHAEVLRELGGIDGRSPLHPGLGRRGRRLRGRRGGALEPPSSSSQGALKGGAGSPGVGGRARRAAFGSGAASAGDSAGRRGPVGVAPGRWARRASRQSGSEVERSENGRIEEVALWIGGRRKLESWYEGRFIQALRLVMLTFDSHEPKILGDAFIERASLGWSWDI